VTAHLGAKIIKATVHLGAKIINALIDVINAFIKGLLALFKSCKPFDNFAVGYSGAFSTATATMGTNKIAIKPVKIITLRIVLS
jgi:hypothetical protein